MRRTIPISLMLILSVGPLTPPTSACTTLMVQGQDGPLVGKSYDWSVGHGIVYFNKSGVSKTALALDPRETPARWTSRFASLTFNQYGRELPNGGMNTAGLVVEVMLLSSSRYAPFDERPAINELQWIQYQLDRFATVGEVVAHADDLRISRVHGNVHYMVCDRRGSCAAIEQIDGKTVIAAGEEMPVAALTNDTYADSLAFLRQHRGYGGHRDAPSGSSSLARFVRTAGRVLGEKIENATPSEYVLAALDDVRSGSFTKWNIVYDPERLEVSFRTLASPEVKALRVDDFDASCSTPVRMLDIDFDQPGDVTAAFADYSEKANSDLIDASLHDLGIEGRLPAGTKEALAALPDRYECVGP